MPPLHPPFRLVTLRFFGTEMPCFGTGLGGTRRPNRRCGPKKIESLVTITIGCSRCSDNSWSIDVNHRDFVFLADPPQG